MTGRKMLLYQFSDILPLTSFIKMFNYHIYLPWYLHGTWYCVQNIRKLLQFASQTSVCVFWKKFDVSSQGDKPYDYKFLYAIWCSDLIS